MTVPAKGECWRDEHGPVRIMAIVEGYVVARRKGAAPFLRTIRQFVFVFERVASCR
jgi:hypothetical protein